MWAWLLWESVALAQTPDVCVETEILAPPDHPGQSTEATRAVRFSVNRGDVPDPDRIDASAIANALASGAPPPADAPPVTVLLEGGLDPWRPGRAVVRLTAQGRALPPEAPLPVHVVFLVETSTTNASATTLDVRTDFSGIAPGGLYTPVERIRVVQAALRQWLAQWERPGTISIVVWDQQASVLLPPTEDREAARAAIDRLAVGLAPAKPIPGQFALPSAIEIAARRPAPCEDHRIVVFTDGPQVATPVGDPIDTFADRLLRYSRLSVVVLPNGDKRAPEYEALAVAGRGVGWYADTTWEVAAALDRAVLPPRRVAQRLDWTVDFDPTWVAWAEPLGADPAGGPVAEGESWTRLYDVMLRPGARAHEGPVAVARWRADVRGWDAASSGEVPLRGSDIRDWDGQSPGQRAATAVVAYTELIRWRAAIHDWSSLLAAVEPSQSPVHAEIHAWFSSAARLWTGERGWSGSPFGRGR